MRTRQEVEDSIKHIVAEQIGGDDQGVSDGDDLYYDLDLSPIDLIDLSAEIHRQFGVELTADDVDAITTIGDLVDKVYIEQEAPPRHAV